MDKRFQKINSSSKNFLNISGYFSRSIGRIAVVFSAMCLAFPYVALANEDTAAANLIKFTEAAKRGDVSAQVALGNILLLKRDFVQAMKWYREADRNGNAEAEIAIGRSYASGFANVDGQALNGKPDVKEAIRWYQEAVDKGNSTAAYLMGLIYQQGDGQAKDLARASELFQKAVRLGPPNSIGSTLARIQLDKEQKTAKLAAFNADPKQQAFRQQKHDMEQASPAEKAKLEKILGLGEYSGSIFSRILGSNSFLNSAKSLCVEKYDLLNRLTIIGPYVGFHFQGLSDEAWQNAGRLHLVDPSDISWEVAELKLSEADRLNGVLWAGQVGIKIGQRTHQFLKIGYKGRIGMDLSYDVGNWTWTEDNLDFTKGDTIVYSCNVVSVKDNEPRIEQIYGKRIIDAHTAILAIGGVPSGWK